MKLSEMIEQLKFIQLVMKDRDPEIILSHPKYDLEITELGYNNWNNPPLIVIEIKQGRS